MSPSAGQSTIVGSVAFRKSFDLSSSPRGFLKIYGFSYGFPWVDGAGHEISAEVRIVGNRVRRVLVFFFKFLQPFSLSQALYTYGVCNFSCLVRFVQDIFLATRLDNSESRCQFSTFIRQADSAWNKLSLSFPISLSLSA